MNAVDCLNEVMRKFPDAGKQIYRHRMERGIRSPRWPAWCFLPFSSWLEISGGTFRQPASMLPAMQLATLGTWRYSQGIYRPDPDFFREIADSIISDSLPADVFQHLPEWCIYVEIPEMTWCGDRVLGFWAHLDYRPKSSSYGELVILFNCETLGYVMGVVLALGPWSIREGYEKTAKRGIENVQGSYPGSLDEITHSLYDNVDVRMTELAPAISILLYICSDEPEIEDRNAPGERPSRPQEKKTKKGMRIFPAERTRVWTLGAGIGSILREAYHNGLTGKTKRPHLRRGHWHGYWNGSHDKERFFRYKWLPPVFVNSQAWMDR
ncbi:hypothetical protein QPF19_004345 [Salmonella enterica]|nr:hypothetical protein [Salmonella enterica]